MVSKDLPAEVSNMSMNKKTIVLAWVHPIRGGDDYEVELKIRSTDKTIVENEARKWLKKRSSVVDDFRIFNETEFKEYNLKQDEYYLKLEKEVKEMRKQEVSE